MMPTEVRFAADGMLLSLARWLRLLGYDCVGRPDLFGRALLEKAAAEDRVLLTRNARLSEYLPDSLLRAAEIVCVAAETLPEQLREVATKFSLDTNRFLFTRCLECNAPLRRVDKADAASRAPPNVFARHEEFWECATCKKLFWHGSHAANSIERVQNWLATARPKQ